MATYSKYTDPVSITIAYESETETLLSAGRYDTAPSTALKNLINKTIAGLKADGVFALGDAMYFRGVHESKLACQNWIKNAHNSTLSATAPTFTAKKGFAGNASSSYINTNFKPSSQGVNYTGTSATVALMCYAIPTSTGRQLIGAIDGTNKTWLTHYTGGSKERMSINNNSLYNDQCEMANGNLLSYSKVASGNIRGYENGLFVGVERASATVATPDTNMYEFAYNNSGTGALGYCNGTLFFSFYGGRLNDTQHLALYTRVKYFYDHVADTF